MRFKPLFVVLLTTFIFTGCSSLDISERRPSDIKTIAKSDRTWQQHLSQIKRIQRYSAQGQIGYISAQERFSSRFEWQYQNPQNYTLKLYSTISTTSLEMQRHPSGMTISDNKGNRRSEADAKMLIREIVGMEVPLGGRDGCMVERLADSYTHEPLDDWTKASPGCSIFIDLERAAPCWCCGEGGCFGSASRSPPRATPLMLARRVVESRRGREGLRARSLCWRRLPEATGGLEGPFGREAELIPGWTELLRR